MKSISRILLAGVATVLPVAITLYIAYWLIVNVEMALLVLVPDAWEFPGVGWLLAVGVVFGVGLLMQVFLFERLVSWATSLMARVPLLRSVYSTFVDLFSLLGNRSMDRMSAVVRVEVAQNMSLIGFVTNDAATNLNVGATGDEVMVYLPMSYQLGGYSVLVPRERVTSLDIRVEDAMRLVLTAGVKAKGGNG